MAFDNVDKNTVYILRIFCPRQRIFKKVCGSNPMTVINKFNQSKTLLKGFHLSVLDYKY